MALAQQILAALEAASNPVQAIRQQGEAALLQLRQNESAYFSTCATILVSPDAKLFGRQLVGYQLKNNLANPACSSNPTLQNAVCERAVCDPQKCIRSVACSIISLAVRDNLWPVEPVVHKLTEMLVGRVNELAVVHGVSRALSQIVDDCIDLLDMQQLTLSIIRAIKPLLTASHIGQDTTAIEIRSKSFDIVMTTLEHAGSDFKSFTYLGLQQDILDIIQACFANLQTPLNNTIVAKSVGSLVLALAFHTQISDELFQQMLQLMFAALSNPRQSGDEQLHIEATLFWANVLHFPRFAQLAQPMIVNVIPLLVHAMVYSDMEMGMLQANANDYSVPDKIDDIRPRHYQARTQSTSTSANNSADRAQGGNNDTNTNNTATGNNVGSHNGDASDNDDNNDDDNDDDDEEVEEWNLRRVSARTLDEISEFFGESILMPVLQVLDAMMQPTRPWKELEAGVLALGAICDGCFDSLTPYLPPISARLLQLLNSNETHFLVVNISLWTCTQIGRYLVQEPPLLQQFVNAVLNKMQSPSKLVQEGAASALERMVLLCDEGQLTGLVRPVINTIAQCMRGYQLKNRVLLFEVLETVCGQLGYVIRDEVDLVQTLLVPLGEIWLSTPNDSPLLFSFFKCMSSVCSALGPAVQGMAKDIFARAYGMLEYHMQLRTAALLQQQHQQQQQQLQEQQNSAMNNLPEPEFLITSADLLSGLFDALGSSLEPLMAASQPAFMQVVIAMLNDQDAEIRQSGFSLTGDIAKSCPSYLQAVLPVFCEAALANLRQLNTQTFSVMSNIAWSLCNLMENQLEINNLPTLQSTPYMPQLFAILGNTLGQGELTADMRNMADNFALCLGWMLYTDMEISTRANCPISTFARKFCEYVRNIKDMPQKEIAVQGFLMAVQQQQSLVLQHIVVFCDLACSLTSAGPEVQRSIRQLLLNAKSASPDMWQQSMRHYNQQLKATLYQIYGIAESSNS